MSDLDDLEELETDLSAHTPKAAEQRRAKAKHKFSTNFVQVNKKRPRWKNQLNAGKSHQGKKP